MKALTPTVCGGGYFVGRGVEGDAGIAHGGAYIMFQHDSVSGNSVGYLAEGGAGPVSLGHESELNVSSGKVDSSNYLFLGVGVGVFAGAGDDSGQVGVFGGAHGRFGGAYANIVPSTVCKNKQP